MDSINALSINIPANFAADCNNALKRYNAAQTDAERRAVLDRQTVQGLWWAIKFVSQLQTPYKSAKELQHAIRLTHFRVLCARNSTPDKEGKNHEEENGQEDCSCVPSKALVQR